MRTYRDAYPGKALIGYVAGVGPLPILMAGGAYAIYNYDGLGSSPDKKSFNSFVRTKLPELWRMNPDDEVADPKENWCLSDPGKRYLIYSLKGGRIEAVIKKGSYQYQWFDNDGNALSKSSLIKIKKNETTKFTTPEGNPALLLLD